MKRNLLSLLFALMSVVLNAQQITGVVVDEATGDSIPFATVQYRKDHVGITANHQGQFTLERRDGKYVTFTAVGYKPLKLLVDTNTSSFMRITLKSEATNLADVTVKAKRGKYRRKNNPAVELMRRVIAAKKRTDLTNRPYYQFDKYQKLTLSVNDVNAKDLEEGLFKKAPWAMNQIEVSEATGKMILPVSVDETLTRYIYRKDPKDEKITVMGQSSKGITHIFQTGELVNVMLKDMFTDVDIYDDDIRLLQRPFTSPISSGAISFYRFYIEDTVMVDKDLCYHLQFLPNNQMDFGFRGELYVVADSSLHVKRCNLTLPKSSSVNFVDNIQVRQEYTRLSDGTWVLTVDDMIVEMSLVDFLTKALVVRTTRLNNYGFDEIPPRLFKGKAKKKTMSDAQMRREDYWAVHRPVRLSHSEANMDVFLDAMRKAKGYSFVTFALKAVIENFVETGSVKNPSKVDIGPINTLITKNFIDGVRTRLSAQTTANLNPHLFFKGYVARGWDSEKNYYKGELTYSFNRKQYLPHEYPRRSLTFSSTYDVCGPSDKFMTNDKDNVFTSFKWTEVDKMMFYNRQQLAFDYETDWGFKVSTAFKTEENEACGKLAFTPVGAVADANGVLPNMKLRTTEARIELRYAPGEEYMNTKQHRRPLNHDATIFELSHSMGLKNMLGGDYSYNFTEASIYKRFWMNSWGRIDVLVKGGVQWNKVPFPLLIMPPANLSYIVNDETFNLIENMEFLNDRYASLDISWDLNGKLFNRIPLLKKLKWREFVGFKCLWGTLSEKNNPNLAQNANDPVLMKFPLGTYVMDGKKPYMEMVLGVHNIFKFLHIQYVHRLNYLELPTATKHGVRIMMDFSF